MSEWNPPPWAGHPETPMQRFNRLIGQAIVNMGHALAIEIMGTPAEKRALHAWMERNRRGRPLELPQPVSELDVALMHMRTLGRRHMMLAKAHLANRVDAVYNELGLDRDQTSQTDRSAATGRNIG